MKKQREVNIELLRLIAMGMIILIHFMTHGLKLNIGFPTDTASMGVVISVYGILCICVNLFVLISGYFGIRITWKSVFKLWFTIYFYNILSSQLGVYLQQENFSFDFNCLRDFFALEKGWWFIYAYLGLMFFSPILNKAFDNFSKKEMLISVALLSILEFYFGYVKQVSQIGFNAYSMLHLIYIYCLGRTIRIFSEELNQYRSKIKYLILVSYFAVLVCSIVDYRVGTFDYLAYKYHQKYLIHIRKKLCRLPILLHGIAAMRAAGLIYALTREMSVVHESGRSISSADFCLTAVQSAVLFLKLLTILNPLNFLTL